MRYADNDPRATEPIIPRCCACGVAPGRGALSPVHLRLTPRFPFVWVYRGRAPRVWWRSCLAALRSDPAEQDAGVHYLCRACLPLARSAPSCASTDAPEPPSPSPPNDASPSYSVTQTPAGRAKAADALARHILELHQVFGQSAMINGATREGHRGIQLARGSVAVRCRACGQDIAYVADLAGATVEDDPMYEYTPAGLRACPATSTVPEATNREVCDEEPSHRTALVLSHARGSWRAPRPAS